MQHISEGPHTADTVTAQIKSQSIAKNAGNPPESQETEGPRYSLRDQILALIPSVDPASFEARETLVNANRIFNLRLNNATEWPWAATVANKLGAHISGSVAYRHAPLVDLERAAKLCKWLAKASVIIAELEATYGLQ